MTRIQNILLTFFASMIPVLELRFSIRFGYGMDLSFWECVLVSIIGNMIPVPFIMLFIRKIFDFCRRKNIFVRFIDWLERRVMRKSGVVKKYEAIGLAIFVGIPLPGTGAWSGALLASLMDIRLKTAIPAICAGVVVAGFLMGCACYGVVEFLGFIL